MQVTTITEARALVGRTFERDGKRRTVLRINELDGDAFDAFWKSPDGGPEHIAWCCTFIRWMIRATEVTEVTQ